ncbi:DUF1684 domain-containing protein [Luethyella okanaganae]|uniref:DUF1684 domain-containing protein n=1 Tax=Luethyella okanaganae TaxID=69372 RepID=A0ABW1VCG9_9MICO
MSDTIPTTAAEERYAAFRERRAEAVTRPQGHLALVNTQWITGDPGSAQPVWGVPGLWSPLPAGESGLKVTAAASDGILVDDAIVDGDVIVGGHDAVTPSELRFGDTVTGSVIGGERGDYALRIWDAASEAIQDFGGIDAFPYDPEWVVEARFTPIASGGSVDIAHLGDDGRTRSKALPGTIEFSHDGAERSVAAFQDDDSLLLVFGDATNGDTTYGVGRFLRVVPRADGTVLLDFNRAHIPPCGFSYNFNCPIPPAQNRFDFRIEAGEKNVLNRRGGLLH